MSSVTKWPDGCRPAANTSSPASRASSRNSVTVRCLPPNNTISIYQASARFLRRHAAEYNNAAVGARRLRAAAQDRFRFRVGPVIQDSVQQIDVSARRQRVEETLPGRRDAFGHAGGPEYLAGERDRARQINQTSREPSGVCEESPRASLPCRRRHQPRSAPRPSRR